MKNEEAFYIPYQARHNGLWTVLFIADGFAIPSNFNRGRRFVHLYECREFCNELNAKNEAALEKAVQP